MVSVRRPALVVCGGVWRWADHPGGLERPGVHDDGHQLAVGGRYQRGDLADYCLHRRALDRSPRCCCFWHCVSRVCVCAHVWHYALSRNPHPKISESLDSSSLLPMSGRSGIYLTQARSRLFLPATIIPIGAQDSTKPATAVCCGVCLAAHAISPLCPSNLMCFSLPPASVWLQLNGRAYMYVARPGSAIVACTE